MWGFEYFGFGDDEFVVFCYDEVICEGVGVGYGWGDLG